jgi:hypothetical protein
MIRQTPSAECGLLFLARWFGWPVSFDQVSGALDFAGEKLLVGQQRMVLGCQDLVGQVLNGVVGNRGVFLITQDQPNRRVFIGLVQCSRA